MKILPSVLLIVNGNTVIKKDLNVPLIKMCFNFTSTLEEIIIVVKYILLYILYLCIYIIIRYQTKEKKWKTE